nr:hypothetical protein [Tanacetum cinerariifolium]
MKWSIREKNLSEQSASDPTEASSSQVSHQQDPSYQIHAASSMKWNNDQMKWSIREKNLSEQSVSDPTEASSSQVSHQQDPSYQIHAASSSEATTNSAPSDSGEK